MHKNWITAYIKVVSRRELHVFAPDFAKNRKNVRVKRKRVAGAQNPAHIIAKKTLTGVAIPA